MKKVIIILSILYVNTTLSQGKSPMFEPIFSAFNNTGTISRYKSYTNSLGKSVILLDKYTKFTVDKGKRYYIKFELSFDSISDNEIMNRVVVWLRNNFNDKKKSKKTFKDQNKFKIINPFLRMKVDKKKKTVHGYYFQAYQTGDSITNKYFLMNFVHTLDINVKDGKCFIRVQHIRHAECYPCGVHGSLFSFLKKKRNKKKENKRKKKYQRLHPQVERAINNEIFILSSYINKNYR